MLIVDFFIVAVIFGLVFYVIYLWTSSGRIQQLQYENRDLRRKIDFLVEEFGEEGQEASARWDKINKRA